MMKICVVTTDFPCKRTEGSVTYGGAGACMAQLVEGLIREGIDVTVVTRKEAGDYDELFNIPIHRTSYLNLGRTGKITHSLFVLPTLLGVCKRGSFDLIHSHNPPAALPAFIVSKFFSIPHVLTMHGPWAGVRLNPAARSVCRVLEGFSVKNADHVTCDSNDLKTEMVEEYGTDEKRLSYIPNAVDADFFRPDLVTKEDARKGLGIKTNDKLVLYTGRFLKEKGIDHLLDAVRDVVKSRDDISFLLVGGGAQEHVVKEWLEKNSDLKGKVFVIPYVQYELMPQVYIASDIFVQPSLAEGLSRSILEAMSCGLAVVATDVGGNPELVNEKTGVLVEPKSSRGIAHAISELAGRELKTIGTDARRMVVEEFSVVKRIEKFIELYKDAQSKHS